MRPGTVPLVLYSKLELSTCILEIEVFDLP